MKASQLKFGMPGKSIYWHFGRGKSAINHVHRSELFLKIILVKGSA